MRAVAERSWSSPDHKVGRLRWPGKGRRGTRLRVQVYAPIAARTLDNWHTVFDHDTSETYRSHAEARAWVTANLFRNRNREPT